jgi:hypothetical protein
MVDPIITPRPIGTQTLDDLGGGPTRTDGRGPLGTDTTPPPVAPGGGPGSGAPPLDPPRLRGDAMGERYQQILDKLSGGEVDVSVLMQKIQELQSKIGDLQQKRQTSEISINKDSLLAKNQEALKKIDAEFEKMKADQTWDTCKKVFSVAAAIIGCVAAIGLALATGGASLLVAGAIVCAVAGATVSVAQTTGLGEKFLTEVCKMKPDDAQKLMTGLVIGFAVAGILFTGGASLMGAAGRAAPMIMTTMPKLIGNMLAKVAGGVALASGVGAGVSSIGKAVAGGELTDIRTDRKGLEADYKRLQQQQEDMVNELRELLKKLDDGVKITAQVVQSTHQSTQLQMRNMT